MVCIGDGLRVILIVKFWPSWEERLLGVLDIDSGPRNLGPWICRMGMTSSCWAMNFMIPHFEAKKFDGAYRSLSCTFALNLEEKGIFVTFFASKVLCKKKMSGYDRNRRLFEIKISWQALFSPTVDWTAWLSGHVHGRWWFLSLHGCGRPHVSRLLSPQREGAWVSSKVLLKWICGC